MVITSPLTIEDFEKYYHLRWEILRKPWNQPQGSEKDNLETTSIHSFAIDAANRVWAVGRLQVNSASVGQVRYMAVAEEAQGKGYGKEIMHYLEQEARKLGLSYIVLDAREGAVGFYERMGYKMLEPAHTLWGVIKHYKMEKELI